ncbi:rab3 GTPase-activating protein catalytic subunit [Drosophila guanche]|uniref:Rab3 GTPase-activating protein catalytic subunit n=1 Tax=Drosophila guanche TaxID=7266 RepID=A0A3B0JI35_DROGU|nr:rab3 GTPase-activating protein catalytic subunit [Drosophila guanche]SPP79972.1 blast:Rab3 GTPase-activating protein catalytic subunit [Drosophila guanche]
MAEEIDDNDFYRENFSADSDWEVFNAQLGEILQKWDVTANGDVGRCLQPEELFRCKWQVESETLDMLSNGIEVEHYQAQLEQEEDSIKEGLKENSCLQRTQCHQDLMSSGNSFGPPIRISSNELHTLSRIYGLRRFIVLHPVKASVNYMKSTAEFNFFLSAAAVVAAEVGSVVPIFVQIYDPKWNFFTGVSLAPALRTNFRLIGLEKAPPECRYLMGLLTLFREKVPASYPQSAKVSVCTTYALDTMRIRMPMYVPFDHGLNSEDIVVAGEVLHVDVQHFSALPHGYTPESCTEIYLVYTWPELSEHVAFDSEQRTDFIPSKAPLGKVYLSVEASSYLSCCLRDYQAVASVTRSLESYVGRNFSGTSSGAEAINPLDKLTEHKLSKRRERSYELPSQAGLTKRLPGPMTESELRELLAYLFPDMHPDMALFPYVKQSFKNKFDPVRIKSAVPDSLVCRLSCVLATSHAHSGSLEGMAQLWAAFTRHLRLLWDNSLTVPGIASGYPDTRTCLLHQKLQMLNVCVERRVKREANSTRKEQQQQQQQAQVISDDEEEDEGEFFDCDEPHQGSGSPIKAVLSLKPEGRLRRLGDERLLDEPEEYLYIPETQEPVPKTEDQLQDDAEVMLKLGPGSGLTTQMMCSSLLSDMEAFKAANPRSQMEDFIRWYSPKDWEEVKDETGEITHQLSVRMTTEGNTWQTVWQQAQPVPIARQKRLFDDTNEALKVLHYLENRKMHEIYNLTIIPVLHSSILKLIDVFSNAKVDDLFSPQIEQLLADLCRLSRSQSDDLPPIAPLLDDLAELERRFYQFKCFERLSGYPRKSSLEQVKLQFLEILRNENCCTIVNRKLTAAGDGTLYDILIPKLEHDMNERLISKDYIIRLDGDSRSTEKGLYLGPQFMRAIVTGEKLRLCGAFTESTAFV